MIEVNKRYCTKNLTSNLLKVETKKIQTDYCIKFIFKVFSK